MFILSARYLAFKGDGRPNTMFSRIQAGTWSVWLLSDVEGTVETGMLRPSVGVAPITGNKPIYFFLIYFYFSTDMFSTISQDK